MRELLFALALWIAHADPKFSAVPPPLDFPAVVSVPQEILRARIFKEGATMLIGEVGAAYDDEENIIYLDSTLNPEARMKDRSSLVHELVHFLQTVNGMHFECVNQMERDAYTLENRWLVENGFPPATAELAIILLSLCPPEWATRVDR